MGLPNVMHTGITGMFSSRAAVATTGHNISNANTEGFSRQRVINETQPPRGAGVGGAIGQGVFVKRIERVNDEYLEKQIRGSTRDLSHMEEKDMLLKQTEDIFNEMNGDGLNRLMSKFFNEFRKLANEPENEAIRQSVREASQAMVNDFHRLRSEVEEVRRHADSRLEGYCKEVSDLAGQIKDLNLKIRQQEMVSGAANDLQDRRDMALKKLSAYTNIAAHKDNIGYVTVDVVGVGPLVVGAQNEKFTTEHSPADDQGKPENANDVRTTASAHSIVTHQVKGGRIGAVLEVRDQTISTILDKLDDLAFSVSTAVNEIHQQGFNRFGQSGINFFNPVAQKERASEFINLSDEVRANINNIATAAEPDSPGDNRIAIALSGLQSAKLLNGNQATSDDWYNSIVSDVGVVASRNRLGMNQQKDIQTQLGKMRDQISGVSIDEETANLLQFQQVYNASAKVIQVADEMLKTVLELKRF